MPELAVDIRDLWVFYNGTPALEKVNLEIETGKLVGILGPNGAGKSTLLKVILGLIPPARGQVRVFGEAPQKLRHRGEVLGYLPQRPLGNPHFPVSVLDVVLMGRYGRVGLLRRPGPKDLEIARRNLERVGIPHLAATFGIGKMAVLVSNVELLHLPESGRNVLDAHPFSDFIP